MSLFIITFISIIMDLILSFLLSFYYRLKLSYSSTFIDRLTIRSRAWATDEIADLPKLGMRKEI